MDKISIAKQKLKLFIKKIKFIVKNKSIKFDIIIGIGDSGQFMTHLTKLAYESFGLPCPKIITLPFYRHADEKETIIFDNSIFRKDLADKINKIKRLKNILFVDDEIGSGSIAKATIDILASTLKDKTNKIRFYIIAENHGFDGIKTLANIKSVFYPYAQKTQGIWSAIAQIVPRETAKKIKVIIPADENEFKYAINILFNLPVKEFNKGNPRYTRKYIISAKKKFRGLEKNRAEFIHYIKSIIYG